MLIDRRIILLLLALLILGACNDRPGLESATIPVSGPQVAQPAPAATETIAPPPPAAEGVEPTRTADAEQPLAGTPTGASPRATVLSAGMATALPGFRAPDDDEPGWLFHGTGDAQPPLAFGPDGLILATGHDNGSVLLWDMATGNRVRTLPPAIPGASGNEITALAFSPDGRLLAAAKPGLGSVDLWQVATGTLLPTLAGGQGLSALRFSPDGRWLAGGADRGEHAGALGQVRIWNAESWALEVVLEDVAPDLAFGPAGVTLATTSGMPLAAMGTTIESGAILLWTLPAGEQAGAFNLEGYVAGLDYDAGHGILAANVLQSMEAPPGYASLTQLLDVETGKLLRTLPSPAEEGALPLFVDAVTFSPDGTLLAVGYQPNQIVLWTLNDGAPLATLTGPAEWLGQPSFNPTGSLLAASSSDGRILFWGVTGVAGE